LFVYAMPINFQYPLLFHSYISLTWFILSFKNNFYVVYRYTKVSYLLKLLFNQFVFFFLILYAFIGFFKQPNMSRLALGEYFVFVSLAIFTIKFLNYILLMKYWERVKGNIRNVVVIGKKKEKEQLIDG